MTSANPTPAITASMVTKASAISRVPSRGWRFGITAYTMLLPRAVAPEPHQRHEEGDGHGPLHARNAPHAHAARADECAPDQPRPGCQSHPHQQCAGTPVTPSAEITTEALATIRLPAATIPPPPAIVDVWLATLRPGEELGFATGASPPSIVADVVLSGELMVLSEGRVRIQRAAGLQEVAPDTVVTIHPGEAIIYVDNQAAQTFRNPGTTPLTALSFGVFSAAPPSTFTAGPVSQEDWQRSGLTGHDLTVMVERLTLPPGAALPAFVPDVRAPRVFVVAEGVAQAVIVTPGGAAPTAAARFDPGQVTRFRTLGAGERLQLRNAEAPPLVLLQVTVSADRAPTRVPSKLPRPAPIPHS